MLDAAKKLFCLFTKKEKKQFIGLLIAVTIMGLLQVAGVASIMPFMSLLTDPQLVYENSVLNWLYTTFEFGTQQSFLFFVGIVVLIILCFSNAFSAFTMWMLFKFGWEKQHRISTTMMEHYLSWPYVAFLTRNTSDLRKNVLAESAQLAKSVLIPALKLMAYGVIIVFILSFLVWLNPGVALIVAVVLGGAFSIIYLGVRRKLDRAGRDRIEANTVRFTAAAEAFGGIKEVKLLGRELYFLRRFAKPAKKFARANTVKEVVSQIPRYAFEALAFGGLMVIVLVLMTIEGNLSQVIPLASVYAFAAHRIMPALQNVFQSTSTLRFNYIVIDTFYRELIENEVDLEKKINNNDSDNNSLNLKEAISLENITFKYPSASEPAVKNVNMTIPRNNSVALVGPTGSGKTTLVDIILGLLQPQEGQLKADGVKINNSNIRQWQNIIGYVPQHIYLADNTIASNIAYGIPPEEIDWERVEKAAKIANLHQFIIEELPNGYNTVVGERGINLSGGQRQRVGIARAVYHDPEVLILDEATSALDSATEKSVLSEIEQLVSTKTMIMIAHRLTTVQNCDNIYVLEKGRVVANGTYNTLINNDIYFKKLAKI